MFKKFFILIALFSISLSGVAANWSTNYSETLAKAEKTNKKVLILFTGSDWCGFCIRLEKNVLSKKDFDKVVKDKYLLVKLDLTSKTKNPKEKEINYLNRVYKIQGFPTTIILDSKGNEIKRIEGAPEDYLKQLK
jgi:protein disulfide-isomerase